MLFPPFRAAFPFKIDRFRFRGTLSETGEKKKERKKKRKNETLIRNTQALPYHFPRYFYSTPTIGRHVSDRRFQLFTCRTTYFRNSQVPRFANFTIRLERGGKRSWRRQEKSRNAFPLGRRSRDDRSENAWNGSATGLCPRKSFYLAAK